MSANRPVEDDFQLVTNLSSQGPELWACSQNSSFGFLRHAGHAPRKPRQALADSSDDSDRDRRRPRASRQFDISRSGAVAFIRLNCGIGGSIEQRGCKIYGYCALSRLARVELPPRTGLRIPIARTHSVLRRSPSFQRNGWSWNTGLAQ